MFEAFKQANTDTPRITMEKVLTCMKFPTSTQKLLVTPMKFELMKLNTAIDEDDDKQFSNDAVDRSLALFEMSESKRETFLKEDLPISLVDHIDDMTSHIQKVRFEIRELRAEVLHRAMLEDVSSDFTGLTAAVSGLKMSIGDNDSGGFTDLWSAVEELSSTQIGTDLTLLKNQADSSTASIHVLQGLTDTFNKRWNALGTNWIPALTWHESSIQKLFQTLSQLNMDRPTSTYSMDTLLNQGPVGFNSGPTSSARFTSSSSSDTMLDTITNIVASVSDLKTQLESAKTSISQLELDNTTQPAHSNNNFWNGNSSNPNNLIGSQGFGSSGVSYKQYHFKSQDDVKVWMKAHMSTPSHGLFVDLVSFSEFFGGEDYVEKNVALNELYLSNKIGYATMADSIVAASFQNVLPGAYGRHSPSSSTSGSGASALQAQPELPGLSTFKKWDNQDGATGRKYWIKKAARNTQRQVDEMLRQQLDSDAQFLAKDLLMDSFNMSDELINFMSSSYQDTMYSGRFESQQAWALTSKFVKRIFTEIADARIIARDGVHISDPWTTAAKFLFATLKAHEVMHDFMRLNIKDHPSISSEMVKFVCYSQPATDTSDILSRLTAGEVLMRNNQSLIARLESRVKRLETQRTESDKLIKKLKEKVEG